MSQFLLPDLGEGLEEAQLVQWLVAEGDTVALNQPICQVETAKAMVDIPSPYAGTVERLHAQPGETVPVGAPLITIAETALPGAATAAAPAAEGHGPVLVGYGTAGPAHGQGQVPARRRRVPGGAGAMTTEPPAPGLRPPTTTVPPASAGEVAASPLVRKMAQERGIDLRAVRGTGPSGRIRVEDLQAALAAPQSGTSAGMTAARPPAGVSIGATGPRPSPGVSVGATGGRPPAIADEPGDERISTVGLRKAIAARMVRSATTIPHFTEYGLFDAAALVDLRARLRATPAFTGHHLTYLPFFVRALAAAVGQFRVMNSRWDEDGNAIVVRRAINVGIATDTERGLLVPVIHHADTLDLATLASEGERLAGLARQGRLDPQSMSGGTITITNVGAAGPVDTGAPLINPPEACVVGFGAIKLRPMAVDDRVLVRPSCWISISCDHRIVDGATAAGFLGALVGALEAPESLASGR
jgi:pyruvate dehydrogenase E2 component (dihydrolipoamide acetyltransferase)